MLRSTRRRPVRGPVTRRGGSPRTPGRGGGKAAELRFLGQFYTSNGISNEVAYVYLATGVELAKPIASQPSDGDAPGPVKEALRMAREGEISDGPSALALLWCEPC